MRISIQINFLSSSNIGGLGDKHKVLSVSNLDLLLLSSIGIVLCNDFIYLFFDTINAQASISKYHFLFENTKQNKNNGYEQLSILFYNKKNHYCNQYI